MGDLFFISCGEYEKKTNEKKVLYSWFVKIFFFHIFKKKYFSFQDFILKQHALSKVRHCNVAKNMLCGLMKKSASPIYYT